MLEMIGRAWRSGECDWYESVIKSVAARRWHGMQQIQPITLGTYRVCVCVHLSVCACVCMYVV